MDWTEEASDERLFAAYCGGDRDAFAVLFERYQGPLCRHLEGMLRDRGQAEDLAVETFVRLHRHRHHYRAGTRLRPWVYTIARNLARNQRRRERLARWLPLAAAEDVAVEHTPPGLVGEIRDRVARAFAALPARQREVCSLRLFGDLGLEEIAQVTGASIGTVKSRLFYGQRRLRELLEDLR